MLQWGHGTEAVEILHLGSGLRDCLPLQWGHGTEAVEILWLFSWRTLPRMLQWGHGTEAVEMRTTVESIPPESKAPYRNKINMSPIRFR